MDATKKQLGVFLLERAKASIFIQSNLSGFTVQIPTDTINDMEIISEEKLYLLIRKLLDSNKLVISELVMVLSLDFTFENDFEDDTSEHLMEKLKVFQDIVPFENVDSKILKQEKKWKVICVNKDLCDGLRRVFLKLNIAILSIATLSQLRETFSEMSKGFDPKIVMDKVEAIKLAGFINQEQKNPVSEQADTHKKKGSNLSILLILLASLFAILLFLVYFNYLR